MYLKYNIVQIYCLFNKSQNAKVIYKCNQMEYANIVFAPSNNIRCIKATHIYFL